MAILEFLASVEKHHRITERALADLSRCWLRSNAGLVAGSAVNIWSPESLQEAARTWPEEAASRPHAERMDRAYIKKGLVDALQASEAAAEAYLLDWEAAVIAAEPTVDEGAHLRH